MSDPVTNVEIEDVLASIRRLVSEDSRPEMAPQDVPGKLVLTPALRVSDATRGGESAPSPAAMSGGISAPVPGPESQVIPDDDYAEDADEPQPLESADLEARFADMVEDEDEDPAVMAPSLDGAAMQGGPLHAEPEHTGSVEWEDAAPAEETPRTYTPADSGFDHYETDTGEEEDAGDFAETPDFDAADADANHEDLAEFGGEEEGILDEETLRELVTDIVRQELQGALGERITRNVRKLVRREIHRALTSHDLQ